MFQQFLTFQARREQEEQRRREEREQRLEEERREERQRLEEEKQRMEEARRQERDQFMQLLRKMDDRRDRELEQAERKENKIEGLKFPFFEEGKDEKKACDLRDLLLQEQLMETLTSDLAIRVREKLPEDVNAAARAADVIVEAKRACSSKRPPPTNHQGRPGLQPKTQREGRALAVLMPDPVTPVIIGNHLELETGEEVRVPVYGVGPAACSVQTRAQSRKSGPTPLSVSEPTLGGVGPKALARMQREDDTLKRVRQNADSGQEFRGKSGVVSFQWYKDLLYRTYKGTTGTYRQLVVPKELRSEVLRLAHDPPMAGHMGAKRTRERAWTSFYWPGMAADVRRYCSSCDVCQRMSPRGQVAKVPLERMPLIDEPFRRVAVDLVGPIVPASDRGYRYILVMVDYATRYPEATPLKNIETETVAEALWNMWTRLGIPAEVLSDRGTQFVSAMMKEVQRLLSVQGISTAPYHAQCNGLVERFNATLKGMLKKCCQEKPKNWDRFIPAVLFAYREVPQESLGFSPFELLYGRTVRGPMHVLKQLWTEDVEDEDVRLASEYVVDLRNRIEQTCEMARSALDRASARHKTHFDKKARPRSFAIGDKVLLLLPGKANKLEVSWQGPFVVMGKKGVNDYRIQIGEKERLYHINVLKRYVERGDKPQSDHETKTVRVSTAVVEEGPEEVGFAASTIPLIPLQASEGPEQVNLDPSYPELHEELRSICSEFRDVLTDAPNSTSLDECEIVVLSEQPVRTQQYPLPHALRRTVEDEVDSMLKLGVIERAASPYSSPIVLVKKPDGKIRFCVDFRKLNKQVEFDAEPMPDVDYLFAKIGKAKYLSKLDLSKGYWQVPLREEDKPKTAFTTPGGQYQWRVMPFGLKTAGAIFSRMMRKLLAPLNRSDIDNFMDDVLIANEAKEEHMDALRALFLRLREVRLSARPSKCFLGFRELEYLGHRVGSGKLWPVDSKVDKIRGAARPTTKKELRAFLGLAGFYRRFVPHFSEIALALTDKTKGGQPNKVKWDENCERAFQTLKARLCSSPVVCLPQSDLPYILRTDASEKGLGAVLLQDQGQGPQPVAYASKKLTGPELNYSVIEKECLAVVWGIEKFDPYLYGKTFVLETDHQPLQHLDRVKLANGRLTRWALKLQRYSFRIRVIPGRENVGADYLSRVADACGDG
nr:hypothetical protein BaRGS_001192 [Batillaria attramentaria]KAG5698105.1 hypothetical protein BaRGS_031795 [Batillaria attramentaria]